MIYRRVIPRDLYNEADLLKCYGRLWICLDNLGDPNAVLGDADGEHDGLPFDIRQDPASGALTIANLRFLIHGQPWRLTRPLNSRQPWPLYATDAEDNEVAVFTADGILTPEFVKLIGDHVL